MTEDLEQYFAKGELIPAVVQEASTGQVLMLAYMNKESLKRTLESGYTWFWLIRIYGSISRIGEFLSCSLSLRFSIHQRIIKN